MITEGQTFQHRYGGVYKYIQTIRYTDRPGTGILYAHLWPFEEGTWVRPSEEFCDGRFEAITPNEALRIIDSMSREDGQAMVKANKAASKS